MQQGNSEHDIVSKAQPHERLEPQPKFGNNQTYNSPQSSETSGQEADEIQKLQYAKQGFIYKGGQRWFKGGQRWSKVVTCSTGLP
jgi:hypothetical protein